MRYFDNLPEFRKTYYGVFFYANQISPKQQLTWNKYVILPSYRNISENLLRIFFYANQISPRQQLTWNKYVILPIYRNISEDLLRVFFYANQISPRQQLTWNKCIILTIYQNFGKLITHVFLCEPIRLDDNNSHEINTLFWQFTGISEGLLHIFFYANQISPRQQLTWNKCVILTIYQNFGGVITHIFLCEPNFA